MKGPRQCLISSSIDSLISELLVHSLKDLYHPGNPKYETDPIRALEIGGLAAARAISKWDLWIVKSG